MIVETEFVNVPSPSDCGVAKSKKKLTIEHLTGPIKMKREMLRE